MKFGNLIDTHCHLINDIYEKNSSELSEVIEEAKNIGVSKLITISCGIEEAYKSIEVSNIYNNVFCSVGIHPLNIKNHNFSDIDILKKMVDQEKVVGVGECGLDYYYIKTPEDQGRQKLFFEEQIKIACKANKPIIIHCRDAFTDLLEILEKYYKKLTGVIHCYTGDVETALKLTAMGFYISFSGIITFKNAGVLEEVVKKIDLNKVLVETDSPYLTPVPYRGEVNYPKHVIFVVNKIAALKKLTVEQLSLQLEDNTRNLFKI